MGSSVSKKRKNKPFGVDGLKKDQKAKKKGSLAGKVRLLQREMKELMWGWEEEKKRHEKEREGWGCKETEWKRERKRLREEVKRLRKAVEEREERIREMGVNCLLLEHLQEEKTKRDEAVEKWKMLYLAIKTELDDLIERAHQGDKLYGRGEEENLLGKYQKELKSKEDTIEVLQAQLASAKMEESKRGREVDILRQSLRIMCNKRTTGKHS